MIPGREEDKNSLAMATITRKLRLGHRANTGEDVREVEFAVGDEVTVLAEWSDSLLCRNADGLLFHVPKDAVDTDG